MSNEPSKGVGDTVAKITKAVGIRRCRRCWQRQQWLNKAFPYKQSAPEQTAEPTPEPTPEQTESTEPVKSTEPPKQPKIINGDS